MGKDKVVKVFMGDTFHRFQRVRVIPKAGDIFILHHSSRFVNDKAMLVERVREGQGFTKVHLIEE